nr:MAG TPA: PD-(D/E)XK nuclease superfamily protein [Herelleviridae sp.]
MYDIIKRNQEELKELKVKNKNLKVLSFSMLSTLEQCLRYYKFNYIDKIGVEGDNVYTYLGSLAHLLIEKLYRKEITNKEAINKWLYKLNTMPYFFVDYSKAEKYEKQLEMKEKNRKYKNNYNLNMVRYFKNFKKLDYKDFLQEQRVFIKLEDVFNNPTFKDYVFNGIVDFIGLNDDGSIDIIDYKTSTMYKGEKLELHSFQLILYAICLENLGFKINRIGWNFLKYARKLKRFKNGNVRMTNVERRNLTYKDEFEDCIVEIDYNSLNKRKALKFIFDNVKKMYMVERNKNIDTNDFPCNYNEFFCKNLCGMYTVCSVSKG